MNLADLLARELESWPECVEWICQDHWEKLSKRLVGFKGLKPCFNGVHGQATGQRGNCWSRLFQNLPPTTPPPSSHAPNGNPPATN